MFKTVSQYIKEEGLETVGKSKADSIPYANYGLSDAKNIGMSEIPFKEFQTSVRGYMRHAFPKKWWKNEKAKGHAKALYTAFLDARSSKSDKGKGKGKGKGKKKGKKGKKGKVTSGVPATNEGYTLKSDKPYCNACGKLRRRDGKKVLACRSQMCLSEPVKPSKGKKGKKKGKKVTSTNDAVLSTLQELLTLLGE